MHFDVSIIPCVSGGLAEFCLHFSTVLVYVLHSFSSDIVILKFLILHSLLIQALVFVKEFE